MKLERQPGQALWLQVEEILAAEIHAGQFARGARMPAEPALMARFGVSRATIRQAIASLERRGLVRAEQGRGTFVGPRRLNYALSERTRFARNLIEEGFDPGGALIREEAVPAGPEVAAWLGVPEWQSVLHRRGLGLADGQPVELADAFVPLDRFPDWGAVKARHQTYTATLAQYGVRDYRRVHTRIEARLPSAEEARLLGQPESEPVFLLTKLDADLDGRPILFSKAVWSAARVAFDVPGPFTPGQPAVPPAPITG